MYGLFTVSWGVRNIERVLLFLVGCRTVVREGISCDRLKDVEL